MRIIGHGIDIVEVERIARMLDAHGRRFTDRCFTESERAYAERGRRAERFAVRFAAKESVMKALGTGWGRGVGWHEIEVTRGPAGKPQIVLHGRCAAIALEQGIGQWHLSLSHSRRYAIASAIGSG